MDSPLLEMGKKMEMIKLFLVGLSILLRCTQAAAHGHESSGGRRRLAAASNLPVPITLLTSAVNKGAGTYMHPCDLRFSFCVMSMSNDKSADQTTSVWKDYSSKYMSNPINPHDPITIAREYPDLVRLACMLQAPIVLIPQTETNTRKMRKMNIEMSSFFQATDKCFSFFT
jgi:hypothetical protein